MWKSKNAKAIFGAVFGSGSALAGIYYGMSIYGDIWGERHASPVYLVLAIALGIAGQELTYRAGKEDGKAPGV